MKLKIDKDFSKIITVEVANLQISKLKDVSDKECVFEINVPSKKHPIYF